MFCVELGSAQGFFEAEACAVELGGDGAFEVGAFDVEIEVEDLAFSCGKHRQKQMGAALVGEFAFDAFGVFFEHPQGARGDIDLSVLCVKAFQKERHQGFVHIFSAERGVAIALTDIQDAFHHLQQRNVECAAAKVEDSDAFFFIEVFDTKGQCRCCGFIDQMKDLETCELSCGKGRLARCIGEIRGNRKNDFFNLLSCVDLCILSQALENERGYLFGSVGFFAQGDLLTATHLSFDFAYKGTFFSCQSTGIFADDEFALFVDRDKRRDDGGFADGIGDRCGFVFLIDRDLGGGGAEIDADGKGFHGVDSLFFCIKNGFQDLGIH